MAKLETVARLLEHTLDYGGDRVWVYAQRRDGEHKGWCDTPMPYDTDANASRELLAYVKAKGVRVQSSFIRQLKLQLAETDEAAMIWEFEVLNATPQQIYDVFVQTFARELEAMEKQS